MSASLDLQSTPVRMPGRKGIRCDKLAYIVAVARNMLGFSG
jgi:hypothetical protein